MRQTIKHIIAKNLSLVEKIQKNEQIIDEVESAARTCIHALKNDNKILLAGNGGSAADAQHIAGELVSKFQIERPGLSAVALTTDSSILTSIGNDYGYNKIFSRQLQAISKKGDVFIAYSTSGSSKNIIEGVKFAYENELKCIGMTGSEVTKMHSYCHNKIMVPSTSTPRIQEAHCMIGHILCDLIESSIFQD